jgi:ppGpp synthetase/RelA/SpoT-type nucleotidyltranferase
MKIVGSIRSKFEENRQEYQLLKQEIDLLLDGHREKKWHYESRLKELESYAQKAETGRLAPNRPEDYFACTIVVENATSIQRAVELVEKYCDIEYKRPAQTTVTHKGPESFPFDDLRLYVRLKANPSLPPKQIDKLLFEVQIKTYLQHAWTIATHDLVYKSNDISWSQQRIAFQIKAILEGAETSILSAQALKSAPNINLQDGKTSQQKEIITAVTKLWEQSDLPDNITRLAQTIYDLMKAVNIHLDEVVKCVNAETGVGRGVNTKNLPPYLIIIQSLINSNNTSFKKYVTTKKPERAFKILIPSEIEIPPSYPRLHTTAIIGLY